MEFIAGEKITDAHPGRAEARPEMARRLSDALTVDVVFSRAEEAIFHGDPHAGNVFHVLGDSSDPYRIALLDWGLYGSFPRTQREQLVQLILGVYLGNAKRVRNNAGAMLEEGLPEEPEDLEKVRRIVADILEHRSETFPTLQNLILDLAREGFQPRFNIALFITSQLTIARILQELDPEFGQDAHFMGRTRGLALARVPETPAQRCMVPRLELAQLPQHALQRRHPGHLDEAAVGLFQGHRQRHRSCVYSRFF